MIYMYEVSFDDVFGHPSPKEADSLLFLMNSACLAAGF
jgi:hypothetical protein